LDFHSRYWLPTDIPKNFLKIDVKIKHFKIKNFLKIRKLVVSVGSR
jgi:hypothetical protein